MESTLEDTENLTQGLDKLSLPIEKLAYPNFDTFEPYRDAPFRKIQFQFQRVPGISHPFLEAYKGKPITYKKLCEFVRVYIVTNGLAERDQTIRCDAFLQKITGTETTSFFGLLQKFNKIIQ